MANQNFNTGKVGRDVVGAGASGVIASEIKGNVIQLVINSPEVAERLGILDRMTTEVSDNQAAGMEGSATMQDSAQLQQSINDMLEIIRSSRSKGNAVDEVQAGNLHLSQVDLLLKKAILLKSDAEQMYFDQMAKNRSSAAGTTGQQQVDLARLLAGLDEKVQIAKLREAYNLLEEANRIDPANTEVLLVMAQLLMELTPDDPTDEQKLLRRIQNLLTSPKNDEERFRLARATFLLATTSDPMHANLLHDARAMFEKLGRHEWIRQCDELLKPGTTQPDDSPPGQGFQPVGQWNVQISDFLGSTMFMHLHANGYFEATQQAGPWGMTVQASGQWVFTPQQQLLQMQGMINGFQPFMMGIYIQSQQGKTCYATGMDGFAYTLSKV